VRTRIRLLLFGTSDTGTLVKQAQEKGLFQGATQFLEMPRFSEENTAEYLMYRLTVAGYSGESPFSPTQVSAICKASDGRPREMNRFAHQCLTDQFEHAASLPKGRPAVVASWLLPAIAGLLALAVVIGLWQVLHRNTNNPAATTADQSVVLPEGSPEPEPGGVPVENTADATADLGTEPDQSKIVEEEHKTPALIEDTSAPKADLQTEPEPDETAADKTEPTAKPGAEVKAQPTIAAIPANQVIKADTAAVADKPTDGLAQREDWLLSQDTKAYTLQLLGSRDEQAARGFIEKLGLPSEKVAYYKGLYKGKDWYVVLYGIYPNRSAATRGIENLPESLRAAKPWPRPLQSVQDAIRTAGGD
jgi:DamX protein